MGEKLGTHINAPSTYQHYRNGSWSVDQIPINFLVNVPSKYILWLKVLISNYINIANIGELDLKFTNLRMYAHEKTIE